MLGKESESLTALEALGVAIRGELDAREIYLDLAERCEDPLSHRRFELLAAEEERHHEFLREKWRELSGGVSLRLAPSQLPRGMATREERSRHSLGEVLDIAIEEERRSREFYLAAARSSQDPTGEAMFRYLADMEYRHWMELAEERDLLARYPNYGRRDREPWRSETSLSTKQGKGGAG